MVDISTLRLHDFAAFVAFDAIADRAETEIVLHGGGAFRATLMAAYRGRVDVDLFDIAQFNSDIDLEHMEGPETTARIAGLIEQLVPFASWCRWSINDRERAERAHAQRLVSTDVPLRRIRLSTARDPDIPDAALADIAHHRVSFSRNPMFAVDAVETRPDLELFGLMMALNTWAEAEEIAGDTIAFDRAAAEAWLAEGLGSASAAMLASPAIKARFWHMLSLRLARFGFDPLNARLITIGAPILEGLGVSPASLIDHGRAFSVSKMTAGASFRVPELTPPIVTGESALEAFRDVIRQAANRIGLPDEQLPADPIHLIDPSLELVGVVRDMSLLPYGSGKDADEADEDPFLSGAEQEFVQIAWDIPPDAELDPHALTGQMIALGATDLGAATALPVVGGTFGGRRAWLRVRLDDLIERGEHGSTVDAVLLILQARPEQAATAEHGPGNPRRDAPIDSMDEAGPVDIDAIWPGEEEETVMPPAYRPAEL